MPQAGAALVIISLIITIASTAYTAYQRRKAQQEAKRAQKEANALRNVGADIKANTRSTTVPMRVIYGRHRVGINTVYMTSNGHKSQYLYTANTISEGPIQGLVLNETNQPYIWFNGDLAETKYTNRYEYEIMTGTSTQTCSTLLTSYTDFTDNMRHTAWLALVLIYNADVWTAGIPDIQLLIDGQLLYDFRNSTTAWSDNPVLALYDFLINERYGCGISSSLIDLDSFEEVADYCDTKGFKINMVANLQDKPVWATVEDILKLFRGIITYWDGKYYLGFRDLNYEASVFTIEDEHILQDGNGKAIISLSDSGYYDIPKAVRVSFVNAENLTYTDDSFIIGDETGVIVDVDCYGVTDKKLAGILGTYELEKSQLTRTISGRFRDDLIQVEPGNIVTLNSTALSISDQFMRVVSATYTNHGFIDLVLEYEDLTLYDDTFNINTEAIYTSDLPDPSVPSLIEDADIHEDTYIERMRTRSRLKITFTVPTTEPWFKHVEVWVAIDVDSSEYYTQQFTTTGSFDIDPVEEGKTYFIKLRTVNIWGVKQSLNDCTKLSKLITGKSDNPPDSLTYLLAIPGDGGVSLRSDKLSDPDIECYEFRYGSQWTGAILLSQKRAPIEEISLVKPGDHTFWGNTLGTNGLYGEDPQSADITTVLPNGWTAYTTFTNDYSSGTHSNTSQISYSGGYYLKCNHTSDVLTGTYTSGDHDTGVTADTYYLYIDTEFVTVGAGTTWDDILVGGTLTWENINLHVRKWKDIFEIEEAPQVYIKLYYKVESTHDWSYIDGMQVLAAVVYARYFKVEITIVDPTSSTNLYVKSYTLRLYS